MFNRVIDDLMVWMDEIENQLSSEDHGKDLTSVNYLLKKHQVSTDTQKYRVNSAHKITLDQQRCPNVAFIDRSKEYDTNTGKGLLEYKLCTLLKT